MKQRGILYLHWGEENPALVRSIVSLQEVHPELPYHVVKLPNDSTLLSKAAMWRHSPFKETLFLDADTVVLDRLDFGFEAATTHGLACCICECPWARRYGGIASGDTVEYNTGVLFFTEKSRSIFTEWERRASNLDSSIRLVMPDKSVGIMPQNDQAGFALAVAASKQLPFVLPLNWNFRPAWHRSWWGPLKVWHDYSDPPADLLAFQQAQLSGEIIQYHELSADVVRAK